MATLFKLPPVMTSVRFEDALAELGMTQVGAANFFGVGHRTVRRWVGEGHVPLAVAMVLELMLAHGFTPVDVLTAAKVHPKDIDGVLPFLGDRRGVRRATAD